jgi:cyclic pyranopterin monophosphate synthase
MELTHFNQSGRAHMVDITKKAITQREATATATITMNETAYHAVVNQQIKKGDVLAVAQVAGIMAVKNTANAIPMTHHLLITSVNIEYEMNQATYQITIYCSVKVTGMTGVEMEALHGASLCALTIYDMVKAVDKTMTISDIFVIKKTGGKSGPYERGTL